MLGAIIFQKRPILPRKESTVKLAIFTLREFDNVHPNFFDGWGIMLMVAVAIIGVLRVRVIHWIMSTGQDSSVGSVVLRFRRSVIIFWIPSMVKHFLEGTRYLPRQQNDKKGG